MPAFIDDEELSDKLKEFGCKLKGEWTHKTYEEFPAVENGIRYIRLELPTNAKSLPYSIFMSGVHLRLKHNGQSRVCNICLSSEHIMRECDKYTCKECGMQGHSENKCPAVKCYRCQQFGHKSFDCSAAPPAQNDHNKSEKMDLDEKDKEGAAAETVKDDPNSSDVTEKETTANTNNENNPIDEVSTVNSSPIITDPANEESNDQESLEKDGASLKAQKRNLSSDDDWTVQTRRNKSNKKRIDPKPNTDKARNFHPRQSSKERK